MFRNAIGSKAEGHGFALLRKRKTENAYRKLKAKEAKVSRKSTDANDASSSVPAFSKKKAAVKGNPYFKAQIQSQKTLVEKEASRQESERKQQERADAMDKYAARKRVRNKKLCKKNYKGQPVLSNQIDLLLEKIEARAASK